MASKTETRKIEIVADAKKADASIKDMRAGVALLNNQLNKLPANSQEFANKSKELKKVRTRLKEISDEAKQIGPAMEQGNAGANVLTKGTNVLKGAFKAAMTALLPLLAFQQIVEWGKHFLGVADSVNKVKQNIKNLTGTQGEELDKLTAKTRALGNTLDLDVNKIAEVANANAKQFGISYEEALGKLEKGLIKAGPKSEEFLEQMGEYPAKFAEAGLSMDALVATIDNGFVSGTFSDKAPDAIKEFGITVATEIDKLEVAAKELEEATGNTFADQMIKDLKTGEKGASDALKIIAGEIGKLPPESRAAQKAVSEIFKGAGEDAGVKTIQTFANINTNLDELIDTSDAYAQRQLEQLRLEEELALAEAELGVQLSGTGSLWGNLTTQVQIFATQALVAVLDGFDYLIELFHNSDAALIGLKQGFIAFFKGIPEVAMQYLGGLADLLVGIVTLDVDKIKAGFVGATSAYADAGKNFANGFQQGYEGSLTPAQLAEREARKIEKQEEAHQQKMSAKQSQHRAQEQKKVEEHAKKVADARKKAKEEELAAEKALQDLRVELIDDETERKLAKLSLGHQRELEQLTGNEQQKAEARALLEEQFRLEKAELEEERRIAAEEQQTEDFETELERMTEEEDMRNLLLEEQFLTVQGTEFERRMAQLDLEREFLNARLTLMEQNGQGQTAEAQRLKNSLLKIEQEKNDLIIQKDKEREALRKMIQQEGVATAFEVMNLAVGFAQQEADEKATNIDRQIEALKAKEGGEEQYAAKIAQLEQEKEQVMREAANKRKKLEIAQVIQSGIKEVASIWASYSSMGPVGLVLAGIQTAVAIGRSALNVRKIRQQQYAEGGFTEALNVGLNGKMVDSTGHAVAGVVHENEWVAPRWMVESPQHANVIGWLESERTRRFAQGGYAASTADPPTPPTGGANSPDMGQMQEQFSMLQNDFRTYAARIDAWATQLQVHNDVRDTRDALNTLNRIDEQSSIS